MKFQSLFLSMVLILTSVSAHATTWVENDRFWATLHFSAQAFSKTVDSVYAHTGVARGLPACGTLYGQTGWDNTQHVQMNRVGDHFFGKVTLNSGTGECQGAMLGPVVQYWVYFTDGTQMITETVSIPYVETSILAPSASSSSPMSFDASTKLNDQAFLNVNDATKTQATHLKLLYAD